MPSVYITGKIPESGIILLKKKGYQVDINESGKSLTKKELSDVFAKYEAVITLVFDKIDEDVIKSAKGNLKIIANFAVGFDNIDVLAAKRRGIVVTNTPGVASESVAEHTMMLILACSKKLIEADRYVRLGRFEQWDPLLFLSAGVSGKTIGIVGLGKIGKSIGKIAFAGFGMKILYSDPVRSEDFEILTEAKFTSLEILLAESDFVTLHVPLNKTTYHLIDKRKLAMMKETAILINSSRGPVVAEQALIWALSEKVIAGAGLDVYEHEPHIVHDLKILGNVILTPHIASATYETREAMAKIAAENIIDVFSGRTPFGLVKVD